MLWASKHCGGGANKLGQLTDRLCPYLRSGRLSWVHETLPDGAVRLLSTAVGEPQRARGNLILNSENVPQLAVVALGPTVSAGNGIDELSADADAITSATDAAFENVAHAELAADLPYVR